MATRMQSSHEVIDHVSEGRKAVRSVLDTWESIAAKNLPDRVYVSTIGYLGQPKGSETHAVLKKYIEVVVEHLRNAEYVLNEIGGEMAGIQAEVSRKADSVTFVV